MTENYLKIKVIRFANKEAIFKGCVHYLNRCTTSPTYILYQPNEKKWAYNH